MWTDMFLYKNQCGGTSGSRPKAWKLYYRDKDDVFNESIMSLIFPRTIIAAGSFWRYDSSYIETSTEFKEMIKFHNNRIRSRGIMTCPSDCKCDELTKCGKKYLN